VIRIFDVLGLDLAPLNRWQGPPPDRRLAP
jgi:hypothetical protein